jgi:tetratricopeptide (TPR) repeat protein
VAARAAYSVNQDVAAVKAHMQAIIDAGGDGYIVQTIFADVADAQKDKAAYKAALEKAAAFDPASIEPLIGLYKLADADKRVDDQLSLLKGMAKLDPSEHVVWSKLLELLVSKGQWDEAVKAGESAVMADLYAPEVHAFYALALAKKGRNLDAANEIQVAKKIDPKDPEVTKAIEILHLYPN